MDSEKEHVRDTSHLEDVDLTDTVQSFTAAEEAAVIRKLDYRLLPLIFVLYSLSVLDRSNLGNARLAGLEDDIDLSNLRYNWLGTAFYIACMQRAFVQPIALSLCIAQPTAMRLLWLSFIEAWLTNDRHPLPMDAHWMEAVPSTQIRCILRVLLGLYSHNSGFCKELSIAGCLPHLPRDSGVHVRPRSAALPVLFLSTEQDWIPTGRLHFGSGHGERLW